MTKRNVVPLLLTAILSTVTALEVMAQQSPEPGVPALIAPSTNSSISPASVTSSITSARESATTPLAAESATPSTTTPLAPAASLPATPPSSSPGTSVIQETTNLTGESPYSLLITRSEKSNVTLKRAAAFPIVYPISTTVAFVRGTADEFKTEMNELKEQSGSKKLAAPAAVLFLPLSALAGFMRAPVIAGDKALTKKPFSKEAFCLEGDIEKLE
jgi:hypothetical protein